MGTIGDAKDLLTVGALAVGTYLVFRFLKDPVGSIAENPAIAIAPSGILSVLTLAGEWIFSNMGGTGGSTNCE